MIEVTVGAATYGNNYLIVKSTVHMDISWMNLARCFAGVRRLTEAFLLTKSNILDVQSETAESRMAC